MIRSLLLWSLVVFNIITANGQAGKIDSTFGINGVVRYNHGAGLSIAVQDDGKLVFAGGIGNSGVVRLNPDGTRDSSFAGDGSAELTIQGLLRTTLQPDGKILVAGDFWDYPNAFYMWRLLTDGTPDNTFGAGGKKKVYFPNIPAYNQVSSKSLALQPDGKIVQAGYAQAVPTSFAAVRYNANGTIDNSFATNGRLLETIGNSFPVCNKVLVQPDGKILLAGYSVSGAIAPSQFALMRLNANGTLDQTFGAGGKVTTYFGAGGGFWPDTEISDARDMVLQPDGKIVLAGRSYLDGSGSAIALARYNTDGTLDASFGQGGKVRILAPQVGLGANAVLLQPDGKLVVTGYLNTGNSDFFYDFMVARIMPNGDIDSTFGTNGLTMFQLSANGMDVGDAIALQSDGKILASGRAHNDQSNAWKDFVLIRFLSGLDLGILDLSANQSDLQVYPNPIESGATLKFELEKDELLTIELIDLQGRVVQTLLDKAFLTAGQQEITLGMNENIPAGVYLLRISNGIGQQSIRVVKQ